MTDITSDQLPLFNADGSDEFQARWVAWANACGRTPSEQHAWTKEHHKWWEFTNWINGAWSRWREENGIDRNAATTDAHHAAFDAWLPEFAARACDQFTPADGGAHRWCDTCGWQQPYHETSAT